MHGRYEELARCITIEHGKVIAEARGEVRRALENVEVAAGVPSLMMGYNAEDIGPDIDEAVVVQPAGVFCCVAPFNFPLMVPLWFLPYAVACGDTYIVKPSDACPMSMNLFFELLDEAGLPPGVVNLVNGAKGTVDALLEHPDVAGLSFVGSTPVARALYAKAAANGKRAQCQAGAKNCLVVMPDAALEQAVPNMINSGYGNSGQRCLAGALLLAVGDAYEPLRDQVLAAAQALTLGDGLDESIDMGPVVSAAAVERISRMIQGAIDQGATPLLDGRGASVPGAPGGHYIGPTLLDDVTPEMTIAQEEVFGPVLGIIRVPDLDAALAVMDGIRFGNAATIYTSNGGAAREFKYRVRAGNVGINIGVVAPVATFPFSGMRDSFFGDLHGQGRDAIEFFTDRKVVISRWY
jgi:malonate-semialdehyde dehydrogenase (acetylating)/methylmalonate-semialdehyde dehydrogenase